MFIVNQNGDKFEELKSMSKEYLFPPDGEKRLEEIYREYERHLYQSFIPLSVCHETKSDKEWIEKKQRECYAEYERCNILVNGILFGDYKRNVGEKIFDDIIFATEQNKLVFDLRIYEKSEEKE